MFLAMDLAVDKKEIIRWINALDKPYVIEQIKQLKKKKDERFDFEKEWENGIPIAEARKNTKEFLASLPWKK